MDFGADILLTFTTLRTHSRRLAAISFTFCPRQKKKHTQGEKHTHESSRKRSTIPSRAFSSAVVCCWKHRPCWGRGELGPKMAAPPNFHYFGHSSSYFSLAYLTPRGRYIPSLAGGEITSRVWEKGSNYDLSSVRILNCVYLSVVSWG